ncbi:MAG: 3-deoxy-7-phosphoheptulonate synthase [Puniceicoccales bacterium]
MQVTPVITTTDINIESFRELPSPQELVASIPKTDAESTFITEARESIHKIIFGDDPRLLMIVGPCSIHDLEAGREYARRLVKLADELKDRLYIVMRVYFEKPRTTVGWKGLIMDPHLNSTFDIPEGLKIARNFLREVVDIGLPTATELLDPITPQYIADLICWTAIGARTTESQTHRQMASGLSMPLGFKNSTDGSIDAAINAIKAASQQQTFLGIDDNGRASAVTTKGNPNCHLVLRGGKNGPNYAADEVKDYADKLKAKGLKSAIMIDCAHDNSGKDPAKSPDVLNSTVQQVVDGNHAVIGAMIESNLHAGNQSFPQPLEDLDYGVSITDPCMSWEDTETALRAAYDKLAPRFA